MLNGQQSFAESISAQLENLRSWCYLMALSMLGRFIWLHTNRDIVDEDIPVAEWWQFFQMGVRYDSMTNTYLLLPFAAWAAAAYLWPPTRTHLARYRSRWIAVLSFVIPFLAFCNAGYFQFNNTVFNAYIFEMFAGNAGDAFNSAIQEHNAVAKVAASVFLGCMGIWIHRRYFESKINIQVARLHLMQYSLVRGLTTAGMVLCVLVAMRGRVGTRPLQRIDSATTSRQVLNLGSLNPIYNLKTAYYEHVARSNFYAEERIVPPEMLKHQVTTIANGVRTVSCSKIMLDDLDGFATDEFTLPQWQRIAAGPPAKKPSHVFILFMESYDSWPFLDKYRDLNLVEQGRKLGDEGHRLMNYLPGCNGSVLSSNVCLQGLFDTNRLEQQCLPTSIVHAMNRLGYTTRSVNGFSSEWSNCKKSATGQGFDEIICTGNIKPGGETSNLQVHDRTLFEFTAEKLSYDQPTFNYIRSSSYHGPFEVDLVAEDCVIDEIPEELHSRGMRDEQDLCLAYGHLKYADKIIGEFVRKMSKRHPGSLFVITGDHYGRHFITTTPSVYEGSSVPLILYGPEVLKGTTLPSNMAASHVDLATTLIELCAPEGFSYTSLGKNILAPTPEPFGVGRDFVFFPDCAVSLRGSGTCERLPFVDGPPLTEQQKQENISRAQEIHDAYHGVGYMLSRKALETY